MKHLAELLFQGTCKIVLYMTYIIVYKRPVGKAIGWALPRKQYSRSLLKCSSAKKNSGPLYRIQCLEMYTVEAYKAKAIVKISQLIRA